MAKKLLTSYTFTPGAANAGTVVVAGTYALEQFLLITNVTDGVTIFQFNKPSKGGTVSTGGGNTTLTLEADTSGMSAGDRLQVFVDDGQNAQVTLTNASVEISNDSGNPLPVSGTVTATGPLTDAQLRAAAVPVSGTVAISNSSVEIANDTGNPIPVGTAAQLNVTGSASALNADLFSTACDAFRGVCVQISGTFVGTITFQVSNDNANWFSLAGKISSDASGNLTTVATAPSIFLSSLAGYQNLRARFTAYTSGTATANAYLSRETVVLTQPQTATVAVSGTVTTSGSGTILASSTTSGQSTYTANSVAGTNAAVIKATAGNLYSISAMNASATTKYVRIYNKATTPTVGTDIPFMVIAIPGTSSKEHSYVPAFRVGSGIGVSITGGAAANDATAVAAGDVQLVVGFA